MQSILIALCAWALIGSVLLIMALEKARMNEKRIFAIDDYLKKRIARETGQAQEERYQNHIKQDELFSFEGGQII